MVHESVPSLLCYFKQKKDGIRRICSVCWKMEFAAQKMIAGEWEGNRTHLKEMVRDLADCIEMALSTVR
jgi:hypothetical protein